LALKNLKPQYSKKWQIPVFNMLLISSAGPYGKMACVDTDPKNGNLYVKMVTFECTGTNETFTIKPKLLRDLAVKGVTDKMFIFHAHPKRGYVDLRADEAHFILEMIDPDDFPTFDDYSNIVYINRKEKLAQVLYDTLHMDERRSRICRAILARMASQN
jgi:hypothetical protein